MLERIFQLRNTLFRNCDKAICTLDLLYGELLNGFRTQIVGTAAHIDYFGIFSIDAVEAQIEPGYSCLERSESQHLPSELQLLSALYLHRAGSKSQSTASRRENLNALHIFYTFYSFEFFDKIISRISVADANYEIALEQAVVRVD